MQKFEQVVVRYDNSSFTNNNLIKLNLYFSDIIEEVKRSDLNIMNFSDTYDQDQSNQRNQRQLSFDFSKQ